MDNITYTLADINQTSIIADFRIKFLLDFGGPQPIEIQNKLREELHEYFNKHLVNNSYICYFASVDDNIAGIGGMKVIEYPGGFKNLQGKRGYIMNMYTSPEFRKKGICSTILKKLMETANNMGIYSFELHATKEGEPVYIKQGFEKHDEPTYRKWDEAQLNNSFNPSPVVF
ncbi:GNAT family N-acetyltransferase [Taibaiella lutea]|uniref:GNAT family N-acetyltransferase n=1 Tax=Taibaiella lutea TaxID=2608001 RepID=A0A5M6CMG5_9BACT|nr:GNAT family N-acetyltransferase [Taibaiella lutea]KAA5536401.1 GNAT family N-acetyltransferase [Taibaiella lutea]